MANNNYSTSGYGFKYPLKYAFGSYIYSVAQVNRNFSDPLLSYSSSVGEKDYSDRLLFKVGKHVCIFDPETGKQLFFDTTRQPLAGHAHAPGAGSHGGPNAVAAVAATAITNSSGAVSSPAPQSAVNGSSSSVQHNGTVQHNAAPVVAAASTADSVKPTFASGSGKSSNTRHITDVVHYSISANSKFVSMCENLKPEKHSDPISQISVYSLSTLHLLKTLNHTTPNNHTSKPFSCSTFCADNKMIAALTDGQVVIWQWEREKFFKSASISTHVSIIRAAPCSGLMLTGSGDGQLKYYAVSGDSTLKTGNLLQAAKENYEKFIDHVWLPPQAGIHKMVALANIEAVNTDAAHKSRKQNIYVFEGCDAETKNSATSMKSSVPSPIVLELKQTITLRLEGNTHIERLVPSSKSFLLVGSNGIIITFERSDDKHEPYIESKRLLLGDIHIIGATIYPTEERMVLITNNGRLLSMQVDLSTEQLKNSGNILNDDGDRSVASGASEHSSTLSAVMAVESTNTGHLPGISELTQGGFHCATVLGADLAYDRPLLITIAADSTARIWNYNTYKCELIHHFRLDEPIGVAFHSNGFQALVSFKDRIRLYNVLMNKLKPCKETILKNCKCLKYSNGSQYWAAASAINVVVYDSKSFQQLMTFQGHMMSVVRLSWAPGDQVLFSAGLDGNVYGWPIAKEGRLDVIAANNRSSTILDMVVDSPSTSLYTPVAVATTNAGGGKGSDGVSSSFSGGSERAMTSFSKNNSSASTSNENDGATSESYCLIVSSLDGYLKIPQWSLDIFKQQGNIHSGSRVNEAMQVIPGEPDATVTAMQVSHDRTKLYVGMSTGAIRIYNWPPNLTAHQQHGHSGSGTPIAPGNAVIAESPAHKHQVAAATGSSGAHSQHHHHHHHPPLYIELSTHAGPVVAIRISPLNNSLISVAADGTIFMFNIVVDESNKSKSSAPSQLDSLDLYESSEMMTFNTDVVLMSVEDIDDHVNEVVELQKMLNETRAKNDFQNRKLEAEHSESMRKLKEMHDLTMGKEKDVFEKQRMVFDKRIRELMSGIESKESDHVKVLNELENKYEHKLADQLEKYDRMSEKMQLLKQKCEGLLEAEKNNFTKQLNDVKDEARNREKKLKIENRRATDDKIANESAFKEIVNQQEDEYEDELRQLIAAAEGELNSERETILKLRTLVQTKNTKLDQLKKKMIELSAASKARMTLLNQERQEKQKLLDTIDHYKKNLVERENALAEKEKSVIELRSTTRTLENFRFVLDHRLQQLSSERGPITSHIEGLEKHISTMYEELVEEFNNKKLLSESVNLKDQKIQWVLQDLSKTRQEVRDKDAYIGQFKREIGNIVTSMLVGKELEESVRNMYKKFVKGETGINPTAMKVSPHAMQAVDTIMKKGTDDDDMSLASLETDNKGKGGMERGHMSGAFVNEVEEALVETAKEADRQKKFLEQQTRNLKHRLLNVKKETYNMSRGKLGENSNLLYECNDLRMEVIELKRKLEIKHNELDETQRKLNSTLREQQETQAALAKATSAGNSKIISTTGEAPTDPEAANSPINRWVVHNSLQRHTSSPGRTQSPPKRADSAKLTDNSDDEDPQKSFRVGIRKYVPLSQSAPLLLKGTTVEKSQRNAAEDDELIGGYLVGNKPRGSITTNTAGSLRSGDKAGDLVSESSSKMTKKSTSRIQQRVAGDIQIEKLNRELESLAWQLDDSQREKDLQRLEINRLRKQLMLSASNVAALAGGTLPNNFAGGLQLPNINNGSNNSDPALRGMQPVGGGRYFTNADIFGVPSEEDKNSMQLGPIAKTQPMKMNRRETRKPLSRGGSDSGSLRNGAASAELSVNSLPKDKN